MRTLSESLKSALNNDNRNYTVTFDITLMDGTVLPIDNRKIWLSGFEIKDEVSSSKNFDIGSAIAKEIVVELNNIYDDYTQYDFTNAVISNIKIGINGASGNVAIGKFNVTEATYDNSLVTLKALDNLMKFDKSYKNSKLEYPATLMQIVQDACTNCGVTLAADSASFNNSTFTVDNRPTDDAITFRNVLTWVAQISCSFLKCNESGQLTFGWYDTKKLESARNSSLTSGYHDVKSYSSAHIGTDDVVITGVRVSEEINNNTEFSTEGDSKYVISIENNKLVQNGKRNTVAALVGQQLIGLRFRPFSLECVSSPAVETGDVIRITDIKGNVYWSLVSETKFKVNEYQSISCEAETPARNSSERYSEATKTYQELRRQLNDQKSTFELAIENLRGSIREGNGLFPIIEEKEDGSKVFYFCDAPKKDDSNVVIELNASGWAVSTDGGKTFNGGMTVDGNMITKILTTIGLNADWINSGSLKVSDSSGNTIFLADIDSGRVVINPDSLMIGGKTVATEENVRDAVADATGLTMILTNEYQGIPTKADGTYTSFPECSTQVIVLYGSNDVTNNCSFTRNSSGVAGNWDSETHTYNVVSLTADSGWVDINASYVGMSVTKRFNVVKTKQGQKGETGSSGVGILSVTQHYLAYPYGTGVTTSDNYGWTTTIQNISSTNKYLWNYETINYSNGTSENTTPHVVGKYGDDGTAGRGISSVTEYYLASSSSSGITTGSRGWTTYVQTTSNEKKYLWNYEVTTYTDSTTHTTTPCIIGTYGDKGADGKGISSVTNYYLATSSSYGVTTNTSGWTTSVQTITSSKKYLWNYETTTFSNNETTSTTPHIVGTYGADGKGISSVTEYYLASSSSSGVTISGYTWYTSVQSTSNSRKYLWNYEKVTYTDGTSSTTTPCVIGTYGDKGDQGERGADGRSYRLSVSVTSLKKTSNNTLSPSSITVDSYYIDGNSTEPQSFTGYIKLFTSADGSSWTQTGGNIKSSSRTFSVSSLANNKFLQVRLFSTLNSGATLLDQQTIPVVSDVDSLTQEQIFNKLTNNGAIQGIYMSGNNLYINGSYIKSQSISGDKIEAKTITAAKMNITDLQAIGAKIGGWTINSDSISSVGNKTELNKNGKLTLGATTMASKTNDIYVNGGLIVDIRTYGELDDGTSNPSFKIYGLSHVTSGGHLVFGSDGSSVSYLSSSSKRYKNHYSEISKEEAENILNVPVVKFIYKDGYLEEHDPKVGKPIPGFYAEDVEKFLPDAVYYNEEGKVENWNERIIIPILTKVIQEQEKKINFLEEKIGRICKKINLT